MVLSSNGGKLLNQASSGLPKKHDSVGLAQQNLSRLPPPISRKASYEEIKLRLFRYCEYEGVYSYYFIRTIPEVLALCS